MNMNDKNGLKITARDRLLRAWQNSTELVRDYQAYADECSDTKEYSQLFSEYAENEALQASKLLEVLHKIEQ